MLAVDTILVARDASPASRRAVRAGLLLAVKMEAALHVLHVYDDRKSTHPTQDLNAVRDELQQSGLVSEQALASISVIAAERQGTDVGATVLQYADTEDVGFIVLGTHGRTGMKRLFMGSVAETVIRRADRAVLTVQERKEEDGRAALGRIDRILVPVDFSEHALESTRVAMEWAALYEAEADLLHVTEDAQPPSSSETSAQEAGSDAEVSSSSPSSLAAARSKLIEFAKSGRRFDVPTHVHVEQGVVGDTVLDFATAHDTDLVAMSTHGRTGLRRFVLGSVTEAVVRNARCPVLTVRPSGQPIRATALD